LLIISLAARLADMPDIANSQPQPAASAHHPPALRIVAGYDGSPPASRALDTAVALLRGRVGSIAVVYVAHVPAMDMMSAAAAQVEADFGEVEKELLASAAAQLDGRGVAWDFQRRQGVIAGELIAATVAIADEDLGNIVVIVVGSSSKASHRIVGSVAVGLARHCPVPLVIVPLSAALCGGRDLSPSEQPGPGVSRRTTCLGNDYILHAPASWFRENR
jgi:nucleotide-binding universal stress UspA family protein